MKVKELLEKLGEFNPKADVEVVAFCRRYAFSLSWGISEGVTKKTAESVSFYVDELCSTENQLKEPSHE